MNSNNSIELSTSIVMLILEFIISKNGNIRPIDTNDISHIVFIVFICEEEKLLTIVLNPAFL